VPNLGDRNSVVEFIAYVKSTGNRPAAIAIDTLSRASLGIDENSQKDAGIVIANVMLIIEELDCIVILNHHASRGGNLRGSTVYEGAADFMVKFSKQGDGFNAIRTMEGAGMKDFESFAPIRFKLCLPDQFNDEQIAVEWLDSADKRPTKQQEARQWVLGALRKHARSESTALTVKSIQNLTGQTRDAVTTAAKEMAADPTCVVKGVNRPMIDKHGQVNKPALHYWYDAFDGGQDG